MSLAKGKNTCTIPLTILYRRFLYASVSRIFFIISFRVEGVHRRRWTERKGMVQQRKRSGKRKLLLSRKRDYSLFFSCGSASISLDMRDLPTYPLMNCQKEVSLVTILLIFCCCVNRLLARVCECFSSQSRRSKKFLQIMFEIIRQKLFTKLYFFIIANTSH